MTSNRETSRAPESARVRRSPSCLLARRIALRAASRGLRSAAAKGTRCAACASATLVVALAAGCANSHKPTPQLSNFDRTRVQTALQLANDQAAAGKFEQARGALQSFRGMKDEDVQLGLARIDLEEGRYDVADARLARIEPSVAVRPEWNRLRGIAAEGRGRWQEAAGYYRAAFDQQPSAATLAAAIDALVLASKPDEARQMLDEQRSRFPGEPALHVLAARLDQQAGEHDAAIRELSSAALADPGSLVIRRSLAEAYAAAGQHNQAIGAWNEAIDATKDTAERHRFRARLAAELLTAGRKSEARRVYLVMTLTHPDDLAAQLGLATACLATDQPAEALAAALRVLAKRPGHADACLVAAMCYKRLNEPAKAIEMLAEVPSEPEARRLADTLATCWR